MPGFWEFSGNLGDPFIFRTNSTISTFRCHDTLPVCMSLCLNVPLMMRIPVYQMKTLAEALTIFSTRCYRFSQQGHVLSTECQSLDTALGPTSSAQHHGDTCARMNMMHICHLSPTSQCGHEYASMQTTQDFLPWQRNLLLNPA